MGQSLHPQRTARRVAALLLALLQFSATSLVAMDAVVDGGGFGASLDVELHGEHHEGGHDHLTCQTIQSLAATAGTGPALPERAEPPARIDPEELESSTASSALPPGDFGPRGPPTL